jgi:diacylglycerol kinase
MSPTSPHPRKRRSWSKKFIDAGHGIWLASHGQSSFAVHTLAVLAVIAAGVCLRVGPGDWGLLVLCIATVLTAETFNSALERVVKAIHPQHHDDLGAALDMASGAVLLASIGAAVTGAIVFLTNL